MSINQALEVATKAHHGQRDRHGAEYIRHPARIACQVLLARPDDPELTEAALLHDVVEDTDHTLDSLRELGFSQRVVGLVDALSRREDESYDDFITRVIEYGPDAIFLKLEDIKDNTLPWRRLNRSDLARRYSKATTRLNEAMEVYQRVESISR